MIRAIEYFRQTGRADFVQRGRGESSPNISRDSAVTTDRACQQSIDSRQVDDDGKRSGGGKSAA